MGAVTEWLHGGPAAAAERVDPPPGEDFPAFLVHEAGRPWHEQRTLGRHANHSDLVPRPHDERFCAAALPPLRPAAFF
jgi:hypothetical protein